MKHKCQGNLLWPIGVLIWQAGDVVGVILAKSGFSWDFFNLFLWLNQEFDNADGEDCSVGSSPIQEDSLSSCPSLPEVYTLPVRDRPDCPDLKNGAGTNQILSFQISSQQLMHSLTSGLLSELLMWIQCWSEAAIDFQWSGTMMGGNGASVLGTGQIVLVLLIGECSHWNVCVHCAESSNPNKWE